MTLSRFASCLKPKRAATPARRRIARWGIPSILLIPFLIFSRPPVQWAISKPPEGSQAAVPTQASREAAEAIARGFDLLERNDAAGAEAAFRKAVEAQPEAELAHRGLGLALRDEGRWDEALRELQVAARLDPEDADAHYALGMVAWTLSAQATSHANTPRHSAADSRDLAGEELNKALALRPQDVPLRLNLAEFYLDTGRAHEALAQAQEAVRLAPQNPAAHVALGRVYFGGGEEDKAVTEFESAAKLAPGDGGAYLALGQLWFFQRKYPRAEQMFRRAIQVSPDLAPAYAALAQIVVEDGRAAEARGLLEKAVTLNPQDWESQFRLAKLLVVAGEVGRATDLLEKVVSLRPDYLPAREQLGLGLLQRGDLQGASARAEALIAQNPQAPEGHRLMALALWKQRNYDNSLAECALALSGDPNSAPMYALQAIALWQLDRRKEAQSALRQAAKIAPKVGTAEVFCRLLLCDARDIGPVTDFLRKNRWLLQPPTGQ